MIDQISEPISMYFCGSCRGLWDGLTEMLRNIRDGNSVDVVTNLDDSHFASEPLANSNVLVLAVGGGDAFPKARLSAFQHRNPELRIVYLLLQEDDLHLQTVVRERGAGYATLSDSGEEILNVIRESSRTYPAVSNSLKARLEWAADLNEFRLKGEHPLHQLTPRQIEILERLARGDSVKEVAKELHLSSKSVDSHKYRIMQKLNIHDRVQITRLAIREGLLTP